MVIRIYERQGAYYEGRHTHRKRGGFFGTTGELGAGQEDRRRLFARLLLIALLCGVVARHGSYLLKIRAPELPKGH